jgi:hypothetical protein
VIDPEPVRPQASAPAPPPSVLGEAGGPSPPAAFGITVACLAAYGVRAITRYRREIVVRFPTPPEKL